MSGSATIGSSKPRPDQPKPESEARHHDVLERYQFDVEFSRSVAQAVHAEMTRQGLHCSGTHLMGVASCQILAHVTLSAAHP